MDQESWYASFVHPAEWMYAKFLNATSIYYRYEKDRLPIEWNDAGAPIRFIAPDFFLPDVRALREDGTRYEGRFVEITTLRRKYVTYKHRKLRLARMHHPQYEFLMVYRSDIYTICEELGLDYEMALLPDQLERYANEIQKRRENASN